MKTNNLSYYTVLKRNNIVKKTFLGIFLTICSWPRTFIENFTRSEFGCRYYSGVLCMVLSALLLGAPITWGSYYSSIWSTLGHNLTWYAYTFAYMIASYRRYMEVRRTPGKFDFNQYSMCTGYLKPWFAEFTFLGRKPIRRRIVTIVEPGVFLIAGLVLMAFKQPVGYLLAITAIIYGLSWEAAYYQGDEYILDMIDKIICNEEMHSSFSKGLPIESTRGFEVYGTAPKNPEFKRKVADAMMDDDGEAADVI